nr:unnamed protein product [Spirometra erinaceieuropaei]
MKDVCTFCKVKEIQGYANCNECRNFFATIEVVYGPTVSGTDPLFSAGESTLLTEKANSTAIGQNFRGFLNRPSIISDTIIARLPQVEANANFGLAPLLHETINAVQQLSIGKASGSDAIPADI